MNITHAAPKIIARFGVECLKVSQQLLHLLPIAVALVGASFYLFGVLRKGGKCFYVFLVGEA